MTPMLDDLEKVLFTQEQIHNRIGEVAGEISRDYDGREVVLVTVLKGAVFFLSELARALTIPVRLDFLSISSFSLARTMPGVVRIAKDLDHNIEGLDVVVIEDIVDTGLTLRYLLGVLSARQPRSLAVCTFLDKATRRLVEIPVKYRCFEVPDRFVVGFGLDYNQRYRTLPCVGILKSQIYQSQEPK
jgi:hypoxanthine phosphoribosyltransferase